MSENIIELRPALYEAKEFRAGTFRASGTLCGHIDVAGPFAGTLVLSPDEVLDLIFMLKHARDDVLQNARPDSDPRLVR